MTLKEKLKAFKSGTAVFHAPTKELWDKLMKVLEIRGDKWASGSRPTEFLLDWGEYGVETCVSSTPDGLYYSPRDYYKGKDFMILELTPYDFPEVTQVTIHIVTGKQIGRAHV